MVTRAGLEGPGEMGIDVETRSDGHKEADNLVGRP